MPKSNFTALKSAGTFAKNACANEIMRLCVVFRFIENIMYNNRFSFYTKGMGKKRKEVKVKDMLKSPFDPNGSYTGISQEGTPTQDVDDL